MTPPTGWFEGRTHLLPVRVYYEDTDTAGIVYYANYLRFLERGRTEMLRDIGVEQRALLEGDERLAFAVHSLQITYRTPARLDDSLIVTTAIEKLNRASLTMAQQVLRNGLSLAVAAVTIACLDHGLRPRRFPPAMLQKFNGMLADL